MKQRIIVSLVSLYAAGALAGPDGLQARLELERPLEGLFTAGPQGRLVIADDVYGASRSFPNDVRIFGADGTQWPCFLHVPKEDVQTTTVGLSILNRSWIAGPEPYLQFDVTIPDVNGKQPVHNRLELMTPGRDFVRRVEIFTGDEKAGHMASGYLIEFNNRRDASSRIIRYPDSDAARLHVRIYPNARSADETFEISRAYLRYQTEKEVERERVRFTEQPIAGRDREKEAQAWLLDLGHANRPAELLHFVVNQESYARCVSVYGRNTEREEWRRVGGGEIHALPEERNDSVKINARSRFLKVLVYHYDDLPLEVTAIRLEAVPRYLVFEAASSGPAVLCFRGWDIAAPRFDLKGRIELTRFDALPITTTLDTRPNSMARTQPWRKYSKVLAGVAVGAVSLLVIWIIAGMLRRQTHQT